MQNQFLTPPVLTKEEYKELQLQFILKVFGWMAIGLLLTGMMAWLTVHSQAMLEFIFGNRLVYFGLIIAQLGSVAWLSARVQAMSATAVTAIFTAYSIMTGMTLASVFLVYTAASIQTTFFISAATFGTMFAYGAVTKNDLTSVGSFMTMGLIGVIIASFANLLLKSEAIYWITSYAGILVFTCLTAYDAQKIKAMSVVSLQGSEAEQKGAIMGALCLYLDFINLFLLMLRFFGRRK